MKTGNNRSGVDKLLYNDFNMDSIERTETSVGPRTTYRSSNEPGEKPRLLTVRLDPHGKLNPGNPILETAAKRLGLPLDELIEKVKNLEVGDSIKKEDSEPPTV